ncbi:unnamed protein product [Amaranthus hypochondriacus]
MLGLSYGEIFLILGATAALIGPKDLPVIARTAGRLAGRAIGYVQLARGQFDNVMQQTQFRQVNKELQDTMAQLDAIRYEIRSISIMNPGLLTRRMMDNPDQNDTDAGATVNAGHSNINEKSTVAEGHQDQHQQSQQRLHEFKTETSTLKEHVSPVSRTSNLFSQAAAFAKLAESPALKADTMDRSLSVNTVDDTPGLLSVLPVSAESAGLLPVRKGDATGSDIILEAVLEAEVARNAKEFFSKPENQIKRE